MHPGNGIHRGGMGGCTVNATGIRPFFFTTNGHDPPTR